MTKNKTNTEIITSAYAVADAFGCFWMAELDGKVVNFTRPTDGASFTLTVNNINKGERCGFRVYVKEPKSKTNNGQCWHLLTPLAPVWA